jgi:hypothetical protein
MQEFRARALDIMAAERASASADSENTCFPGSRPLEARAPMAFCELFELVNRSDRLTHTEQDAKSVIP